ncbi:MAG TPA: ammonium transporter, partial [Kiloniellaceae bacterium]|nr:ammonium transporter [Kiloniellaceae bacterium]
DFVLLVFVPGCVLSLVLKGFGLLRVSEAAELAGLDRAEVPVSAYPESINPAFTNDTASPNPAV